MMNAVQMSKMIRAKKKKMEEESGAVKLSGIPEDATDHYVNKMKEEGEELSENEPKVHPDGESLSPGAEMDEEKSEQSSPEDMTMSEANEQDLVKKMKRERIGKMMSKMGR